MRFKAILLNILSLYFSSTFCQEQSTKHEVSLSIPLIISNTKVPYYVTGNPRYSTATALSYGLEISYKRDFHSGFWVGIGIGLFKQRFAEQHLRRSFFSY